MALIFSVFTDLIWTMTKILLKKKITDLDPHFPKRGDCVKKVEDHCVKLTTFVTDSNQYTVCVSVE